jgi:hypothetical protein
MTSSISTVAYIGATILFILCLGGLSNPETSRRGNLYGIIGMAIAVLATIFGPQVTTSGLPYIVAAMVVGAGVGLYAARVVKMTQMPELVALMHSLVGLCGDARRLRQFHRSGGVGRHDARREGDPRDRDVRRRADRRGDVLGLVDRVRQALGEDHRQARAVAGRHCAQPRRAPRRHLLRLRVRQRAQRRRGG